MKIFCADASYLISLYDKRQPDHEAAEALFEKSIEYSKGQLLIAWPVLYETLSTRMARRRESIRKIESEWSLLRSRNQLSLLSDLPYRESSLEDWLESHHETWRALSLVDRIIRKVVSDKAVRIDALLTSNIKDFLDVCTERSVELLPQKS